MSSTMKRRSARLSSPPMKEIDMEDTMMIQRTDSNETPLQMSEGSWSEDDGHNDHDDHNNNDDNHDDNHVNVISKNSKNSKNNKNEVDIVEVNNPYLEKIRQKREFNKQKLHALGLNEFNKNLKRQKQKLKDERKKRRLESKSSSSSSSSRVPTRRSARKANKPALYTGEELETLDLTKSKRAKSATGTSKKIKRRKFDLDDQIDKEKRMLYLDVPHQEWLQDLRYYFKEIQGNSDSNVQRVTTAVQKLMLGYGIRHPATGAYFKKNVKILLSDDFKQMLDEASEWVYNNGGDRGHGWLVEHPVKKCFLYQQARAEKGRAFLRK